MGRFGSASETSMNQPTEEGDDAEMVPEGGRGREREREGGREGGREGEKQRERERETERQRQRQRQRGTDRQRQRERGVGWGLGSFDLFEYRGVRANVWMRYDNAGPSERSAVSTL